MPTLPSAPDTSYPGELLGLPRTGRGSLASWQARILALIFDWAGSMAAALVIFGTGVITDQGWKAWMILATFFVESTILSALAGGSFGQILLRIAVFRMDAKPLGFPRAILRAALVSLVIPPLVIDGNRRGLHDLVCGTVVINRR